MARQVERVGFDAVYVSGAGIANATAGVPDIGLLTLTEVAHWPGTRESVKIPQSWMRIPVGGSENALVQSASLKQQVCQFVTLRTRNFPALRTSAENRLRR